MAELYRKSALEKISSPEQLDKALVITSPLSWIALLAVTAMIIVAVVWSIIGKIPVTVSAKGVISSTSVGTIGLYATDDGEVDDILVEVGSRVVPGDPILKYGTENGGVYTMPFHWKDTIRAGVGMEYDLFDWMAVRCGYTFDEDPSKKHLSTTMLPAGDRHIIGSGLGFKITDSLWLDLGYSFIRMNNVHYYVTTSKGTLLQQTNRFSAHNGYSHIVSATIRYSF